MVEKYKIDIAFVILHFNVFEETINCVKSIKKNIDTERYHIIIVDNGSPNQSGKILYDKYKDDNHVSVILHDTNDGFARGNNVGIDYVRENLNSKYICCLNNDTLLQQKNFFKSIDNEYKSSNASLIGPRIILKNNVAQPFQNKLRSTNEYVRIRDDLIQNKISRQSLMRSSVKKITVFKKIYGFYRDYFGLKLKKRHENVILHGCCIIFTPTFFSSLSGFDSRTFMFREEELLYLKIKRNELLTVYCPNIRIHHLEDAATNSIAANNIEKNIFLKKNQIESLNILINEVKKYDKGCKL